LHDLHEPPGTLSGVPVRADLLINLKRIATKAEQCLPKAAQKLGVLAPFVMGNDITVGLKEHANVHSGDCPQVYLAREEQPRQTYCLTPAVCLQAMPQVYPAARVQLRKGTTKLQ
jgi:hypothetical protein